MIAKKKLDHQQNFCVHPHFIVFTLLTGTLFGTGALLSIYNNNKFTNSSI